MSDVSFYLPIAKVDRERRMVFGYASTPTRDLEGEVIELDAIKDALPDYMQWCNIREMHQPSAVGVAKEANVDDKGLYIGAKIVDDDAWKKVTEEVYKGFSIGGDVTGRKGSTITGLQLIEISLVDRPANPDCRIDVIKAVGRAAAKDIAMADLSAGAPLVAREADEVGWLRRMVERLAGGTTTKADKEPYGDVEYADPGYQKDKQKRYPIDTEEHIRAAWNYIHQGKNAEKYSAEQVASIKRRIVAAWKKKIDEKGPPEADKAAEPEEEKLGNQEGHQSEPVDGDDVPAGRDGFSRPAKAAIAELTKGMAAAAQLACVADQLECAESCLRYEAADEHGDQNDCELADMLCQIRCDVLDVIEQKARHEKREEQREAADDSTNDISGADKMADADLAKRAASGRHADHMRKAAHHVAAAEREFEKLAARGREDGDAEKVAALRKAARDAHERGMEHLALAAHHLARAGGGERGEGPGDSEGADYKAPAGEIEPKSQREMTEGNVPAYEADRAYPGKSARVETVSKSEAELMARAARLEGELEALKKQPANPKARLFSVPRGSLPVGEAEEPSAVEKLFKGVDVEATDPARRQAAGARMIGNMIANSATFARPVLTDPNFHGGAGR